MARHAAVTSGTAEPDPSGTRVIRLIAVAVVWLAGLAVGIYALLSVGARLSCGRNARGLACRPTGTVLGVLLVLAVIGVVTAVTVCAPEPRRAGRLTAVVASGLVALLGCFLAARALLNTA